MISLSRKGDYEDLGLDVVYDEHQDIGPIEGIYQVLSHAQEEYVFICAADMPFITKELVAYMTEFISSDYDCYCMMDEDHIHPLCAIYSEKMLPVIKELIDKGQYRLMNILHAGRTKYIRQRSIRHRLSSRMPRLPGWKRKPVKRQRKKPVEKQRRIRITLLLRPPVSPREQQQ